MFRIKEVCLVVLHYIAGPSGIAIHLLIKEQKSIHTLHFTRTTLRDVSKLSQMNDSVDVF